MKIRIDIYHHFENATDSSREILTSINQKLQTMSKTIEELSAQATELQASLDLKQAELEAAIASKEETIANLTIALETANANLVDGGTPEQRQALSDQLAAIKADLESTNA